MRPTRAIVVRLVAIVLAMFTARMIYVFSRAVDPQESPLTQAVLAAIAGVVCHIGLFLSADADARSGLVRTMVVVLMLPATVALAGAAVDVLQRLHRGNPLSGPVMFVYGVSLAVYVAQVVAVLRPRVVVGERATTA